MQSCSTNKIVKFIRIVLSLAVIVLGILAKNWIGILGVFTLISAFTGSCALSVNIRGRGQRSSETENQL